MKIRKHLPLLITAGISVTMLLFAFLSSKVNVSIFPYTLYEKLGLYYQDANTAIIANNTFSLNGTSEAFISVLKLITLKSGVLPYIISALFYAVLVTASICMLTKSATTTKYKWTAYLTAVLLPLMFLDFSNIAYFKTLYNQPLVLTLLLLMFAVFTRVYQKENAGIPAISVLFVLSLVYSCTGIVQAVTAIIAGILIAGLSRLSKTKTAKITALVLGTLVVLQSVVFTLTYKPYDYKQQIYNAVFFGVCKYDSVAQLGLDESLNDFKGVYYGTKENEAKYDLENNFYSKISYSKIMKYYITHPVNALKITGHQASLAFYNDNDFGFTPYSTFKKLYVPAKLITILVFAVASAIVCLAVRKSKEKFKYFAELYIGLAVMLVVSLLASAIYHGNCDVNFNMYTFNIIFDIMLASGLVCGIRLILGGQDEKKEKFGITHE